MDEEFEEDLYGWAASIYEPGQPNQIDLTQYECTYSIDKAPTGEESISLSIQQKGDKDGKIWSC